MTKSETPEEMPLSNIHSVLGDAMLTSENAAPMKSMSVRMYPWLKDQAGEICKQNGTDLSTFLRQCAIALVNDYRNRERDEVTDPEEARLLHLTKTYDQIE